MRQEFLKSSRRLGKQVTWVTLLKVPACNKERVQWIQEIGHRSFEEKNQALAGRLHENQWRGKRGADTSAHKWRGKGGADTSSAPKCLPVTHQHFVLHSVSLHFQLHLLLHWDFDLPANHILYAFWKKGKISLYPFFSEKKGHQRRAGIRRSEASCFYCWSFSFFLLD